MNWYLISKKKYHRITFSSQNIEDITDLNDDFVDDCISCHQLFYKNTHEIVGINMSADSLFLGDKYQDFVQALFLENDTKKASRIWKEKCKWFKEKGREYAKLMKEEPWKYKDPGSQSFGKNNPIIADPREWYGENYQSVEVGLKMDRFQALMDCKKNIDYMDIPNDIFKIICNWWLKAEVDLARNYLLSLM